MERRKGPENSVESRGLRELLVFLRAFRGPFCGGRDTGAALNSVGLRLPFSTINTKASLLARFVFFLWGLDQACVPASPSGIQV